MSLLEVTPIYLNWTFWSFVIALIALMASQESRIKLFFKKPKLDFEVFSKIDLMHNIGNCGINAHLHLHNIGGSKLTIRGVEISISRDEEEVIKLPSQGYFKGPTDIYSLLFTKFSLSPDEEWSHNVTTYQDWSRQNEKILNEAISNLQAALKLKKDELDELDELEELHTDLIEGPDECVQPFNKLFEDNFVWLHGEYKMKIKILTDISKFDIEKTYKFTLFEYDEQKLRDATEDYKYGAGIYWIKNNSKQSSIKVQVKEDS